MSTGILSRTRRRLAGAGLLVVAAAAGWQFWIARPFPAAAPAFVFRDGFEHAVKMEDLFPRDFSRWHGWQREAGTGATANEVALTTERVHSGAQALKCVAAPYDGHTASKADIERGRLRFVKGDDVWFRGSYWLKGGTDASLVFLWDLESTEWRNSPGRRLYLQNGETLASDLGKWWSGKTFRAARGAPKFPKERWVELRVHLFLSENNDGRMEVWQDGTKVIDAIGKTLPTARTIYNRLQVGLTANGNRTHPQTLFVDDIVLSNRPLE